MDSSLPGELRGNYLHADHLSLVRCSWWDQEPGYSKRRQALDTNRTREFKNSKIIDWLPMSQLLSFFFPSNSQGFLRDDGFHCQSLSLRFLVAWSPAVWVFDFTKSVVEVDLLGNAQADLGTW